MITDLLKRLGSKTPAPLPPLDANLAMGALLVRMARSDRQYAVEEIRFIDRLIAQHMQVNAVDAAKTRATCEKLADAAPDTTEFTDMVQRHVSQKDRLLVLEALWMVSLADGALKPEEAVFLADMAVALGIPEADARRIEARHNL